MSKPKYLDPNHPVDVRVDDLMSRMTLEDKLAQMGSVNEPEDFALYINPDTLPEHPVGAVLAKYMPIEDLARIQKNIKEKSRLGIPAIIFAESLHGLMRENCTVFPQSITLGSSFDEELVGEIATVIGKEAAISGIRQTLAPFFVAEEYCPVTPFVKRLRRISKTELAPGESREISFVLGRDDVSYIGQDMKRTVGSGKFTVTVGNLTGEFTL